MSKMTRFATPLIAVAIMTSVPLMSLAQSASQQPQTEASAAENWNQPPAGPEEARQGFMDGIQAAQLDKVANRKIDPKSSHLYLHPPVKKGPSRDTYLSSFEAGYKAAVQHGSAS